MVFKGNNYRKSKKAVRLPESYWDWKGTKGIWVAFGRICSKATPGAIRTDYTWINDYSPYGDPPEGHCGGHCPVYAKRIEATGYSLTNLMYGADGYMYLAKDGDVFVRKYKKPEKDK